MNAGTWSGLVTAVLLALFVYSCFWAYSKRRTADFEEAARLPLEDAPLEADNMKGGRP
ncbi:CcoQ/FixQ family Cbb3-type cytochrome c oxidase assembly chaperone [Xanthomonadaceae bacterium JHOS43]|nr:CcoQ/FixQ family Cbb3-type cytochrome c oxidase assembly chaperone [Xanthomonadaceae bacterium JHOS43]